MRHSCCMCALCNSLPYEEASVPLSKHSHCHTEPSQGSLSTQPTTDIGPGQQPSGSHSQMTATLLCIAYDGMHAVHRCMCTVYGACALCRHACRAPSASVLASTQPLPLPVLHHIMLHPSRSVSQPSTCPRQSTKTQLSPCPRLRHQASVKHPPASLIPVTATHSTNPA